MKIDFNKDDDGNWISEEGFYWLCREGVWKHLGIPRDWEELSLILSESECEMAKYTVQVIVEEDALYRVDGLGTYIDIEEDCFFLLEEKFGNKPFWVAAE